jgi:hypothetical protein
MKPEMVARHATIALPLSQIAKLRFGFCTGSYCARFVAASDDRECDEIPPGI